jgi:hypothetical protein
MHCSMPMMAFGIQVATYRVELHNAVDMCPKRAVAILLMLNLIGDPGIYVSAPNILFLIRRRLDRIRARSRRSGYDRLRIGVRTRHVRWQIIETGILRRRRLYPSRWWVGPDQCVWDLVHLKEHLWKVLCP